MAVKPDLGRLAQIRISGDYLWDIRAHRGSNWADWKERLERVDQLYSGDWTTVFPDEQTKRDFPHIMNLVQVGLDDVARLVAESEPSVRCEPFGEGVENSKGANTREVIAETIWHQNQADLLIPRWAMDLAGAGAAFAVLTADPEGGPYPRITRIDPRMAFPDVHNGVLQDLLVVQVIKYRQAARLYPELDLPPVPPEDADSVELLEYYAKDIAVRAVTFNKKGTPVRYSNDEGAKIVQSWDPGIGQVPVAFVQLDSFDGSFRGMFDQIIGSLRTKNRIVKLMLDYTDQLTYAPPVSKGLLNEEALQGGPNAHLRLDPNVVDSRVERLAPAGSSPQLFALLEFLDREQRGGASYPAVRSTGDPRQSIASASFISAAQGQLTSTVRNVQRLMAFFREQIVEKTFRLDEKHLDEEKPMIRALGKKKTYKPSSDIKGIYTSEVVYGAGAGLDRLNADVRILQHLGARLISKRTAREQLDYMKDPDEEQDVIEREMTRDAGVAKFFTDAPYDMIAEVLELMDTGKSAAEAIAIVTRRRQEAAANQATAGAEPAPGEEGFQPSENPRAAQATQQALQRGRTTAVAGGPRPSLNQVLVQNPLG